MLKHFYLVYYIFALIIGSAGSMLSFFRYSLHKTKIDLWHGLFMFSLLLINIGMLGGQYLEILQAPVDLYHITNLISLIASGLTIIAILQFAILYIQQDRLSKLAKITSWIALISTLTMTAGYWTKVSFIFTSIQFILLTGAITYSASIIIFLYKRYPQKNISALWLKLRKYCVIGGSIITPILLILDFFPGINGLFPEDLLPKFSPLLLLYWNTVFILLTVKDQQQNKIATNSPDWAKYKISPREQEVIIHLLAGHTYKEIAELLFISPGTVKTHVLRVYAKTGVSNKTQLGNLLRS